MTTTYTTCGDVRGSCGHNHRRVAAAVLCLISDRDGCQSQGGYSDRVVIALDDGEPRPLNVCEEDTIGRTLYQIGR